MSPLAPTKWGSLLLPMLRRWVRTRKLLVAMGFSSVSILRKNYTLDVPLLLHPCVLPGGSFSPGYHSMSSSDSDWTCYVHLFWFYILRMYFIYVSSLSFYNLYALLRIDIDWILCNCLNAFSFELFSICLYVGYIWLPCIYYVYGLLITFSLIVCRFSNKLWFTLLLPYPSYVSVPYMLWPQECLSVSGVGDAPWWFVVARASSCFLPVWMRPCLISYEWSSKKIPFELWKGYF